MCRIPADNCVTGEYQYQSIFRCQFRYSANGLCQSTMAGGNASDVFVCLYESQTTTSVRARQTYTSTLPPAEDTVLSWPASYAVPLCTYIRAWVLRVSGHVGLIHQHCHRPRIRPLVDQHWNTGRSLWTINTYTDRKSPSSTPLSASVQATIIGHQPTDVTQRPYVCSYKLCRRHWRGCHTRVGCQRLRLMTSFKWHCSLLAPLIYLISWFCC